MLLQEIAQKIIDREIVDDQYIRRLTDAQLQADIREYNHTTASYKLSCGFSSLYELENCYGYDINGINYPSQPEEVQEISKRMAHYLLYENFLELIYDDIELAQTFCYKNSSADERWSDFIHVQLSERFEYDGGGTRYFELDGVCTR